MDRQNTVSKDQFIELLSSIAEAGQSHKVIVEEHLELVEIIETILFTLCSINIDYVDLLRFTEHCDFVSCSITRHKGQQASTYASISALDGVLGEDEKANVFVTHVSIPQNYSFDELSKMGSNINCKLDDEGDSYFQFDVSSKFKSDEIMIYMLCGHTKKEDL